MEHKNITERITDLQSENQAGERDVAPENVQTVDHTKLTPKEYNDLIARHTRNKYFQQYRKKILNGQLPKYTPVKKQERITCECGITVTKNTLQKHRESQRHGVAMDLKNRKITIIV
jgi:hypothetical protein